MPQAKLTCAALLMLTIAGCAQPAAEVPDVVLINGKVLTVDSDDRIAEAIAIDGKRIVAVGSTADVQALAGGSTRIIDLGGRTVIPGLIDSHIHALRGGLSYTAGLDWSDAPTLEDALNRIRRTAAARPAGAWIRVTHGWHPDQFAERRLPTPAELNGAAPDHPVYVQLFYEIAILNRQALTSLGIEGVADLPLGTRSEQDEEGRLTGVIWGNFAGLSRLIGRLPDAGPAMRLEGTRALVAQFNRFGMTGVIDAGGSAFHPDDYHTAFSLWRQDQLPLRVAFRVMSNNRGRELADYRAWSAFMPQGFGDAMLKFNGFGEVIIWQMHDGALMTGDFDPPQSAMDDLREAARWIAERGYTLGIHAASEASARLILDIFEELNQSVSIADLRWAICHIDAASTETLQRMKELGMAWAVQNRFYYGGDLALRLLGSERARTAPPVRSAMAMGLIVAGGSDGLLGAPFNPWFGLRWMLDGKSVSRTPVRGAAELPDRMDALRAYTLNGAWLSFDDDERGSLEPGKLADLAVLSADYMTVPVDEIASIESVLTLIGGRVVHTAGAFAELASGAGRP